MPNAKSFLNGALVGATVTFRDIFTIKNHLHATRQNFSIAAIRLYGNLPHRFRKLNSSNTLLAMLTVVGFRRV